MMKIIKKTMILISTIAQLILVFGCSGNKIDSISFFSKQDTIHVGEYIDLEFSIEPKDVVTEDIYYVFNDDSLFTEDEDGNFIASKEGVLKVTIEHNDITYDMKTISITPILLENISVEDIELGIGREEEIEIYYLPKNCTNKDFIMSSSDSNIAKISGNKVMAVSEGIATITVKATNNVSTDFFVKVVPVIPNSINITGSKNVVEIGSSFDLGVNYNPLDVTNKDVTWISSNKNIATVDNNGRVVSKNVGVTTISAIFSDEIYDSFELNVEYPQVSSISLSTSANSIYVGDTLKTYVNFVPNKVNDESIEWISSDDSIASISENGVIEGISPGSVTITGVSSNYKKATIKIDVKEKENILIPAAVGVTAAAVIASEIVDAVNTNSGETVWLSATGEKYHSINNCGRMNPKKARQVTLDYAIQHGYKACSKCH